MPTSDRKIRANRENGGKSPGPIDTSKSRFSARKHGLASKGLTAIDDDDAYRTIVQELKRDKNPVGILETELVEAAAFDMVGWRRARLLEGQQITSLLHPPQYEKNFLKDLDFNLQGALLDPGIPAAIGSGNVQQLVNIFQRYQSCFSNRLFRTLHELERLQRMRQGERVPAPDAVDLSVHADAGVLDSTLAAPEPSKAPTGGVERLLVPTAIDVSVHADAGVLDSTLAAPEPSKAPTGGVERLPVPAAIDVTVDADAGVLDSTVAAPEASKTPTGGVERLPVPAAIDVTVDADAGRVATPAAPEPSEAPSSDGGRLPARGTEDVDGYAESGLVELAPAEPEQGAALTGPEVTDRKVPVRDPALAWKPRAPAGPIWKR